MNIWTKKSIELATSPGYLDRLHDIYPVQVNPTREISGSEIDEIRKLHLKKDKAGLIKRLLQLDKFPIDDPYIAALDYSNEIFTSNPKTVQRIGNRLLSMDFDALITLCKQPKSGSRQMGNAFKKWLRSLGYPVFENEDNFEKNAGACFLVGSDVKLKNFVNNKLHGNLTKGIDFVLKIKPSKFVIGEAKFITDFGGSQTNQLDVALGLTTKTVKNTVAIAVIDGIAWFGNYQKKIAGANKPVMSAVFFKEFVASMS